jgi:hypothetical protein
MICPLATSEEAGTRRPISARSANYSDSSTKL